MFEVKFYRDRQGNEPIADYIIDLNNKAHYNKSERKIEKNIGIYISAETIWHKSGIAICETY